ncbi:hypothetical protein CEUSTIGMA_g2275.t1 [Chlamydomonas eustigma]|uniref:Uncharacterized protein n=1 Tax=Chlamydomonas eustigma TaxID=1157962 RepID=A0A250WVU8_9CHLO|nr:hypothetical protein CEUSTIGMA_g2275.t1 [Chlamydomonas eustigma]|eukprot:GAX74829.1 hypothetical protein CEUSTIGMA_g2275.t1 [Chlamydomonas eustigma]
MSLSSHCSEKGCEPAALYVTIQNYCKRCRPLHKHQHQLFWDLLLVLRGGRPAMLLDYAMAPASVLEGLLQAVQSSTGISCAILSWGTSCHLLCNLKVLLGSLQSVRDWASTSLDTGEKCPVLLLGFKGTSAEEMSATSPSLLTPSRLSQLECKEILCALKPLEDELLKLQQLGQKLSKSVLCLDLERVEDLPLMPTLNGLLLGYPVVYVVGHGSSSNDAGGSGFPCTAKDMNGRKEDMVTLCAFSLPTSFLSIPEELVCQTFECKQHQAAVSHYVGEWKSRIQSAMTGHGWGTQISWKREDMGIQPVSL